MEISTSRKWHYQLLSILIEQKNYGESWFTNTRDYLTNVYLLYVNSVRSEYVSAFEFGPRDFAWEKF